MPFTQTDVKYFHSSQVGAPVMSQGGAAGLLIALLDACLVDGFGLKTVDSIVVASGVATANVSTGHSAIKWGVQLVAGSTTSALNGEKRVLSVPTANTFTFDATGVPDGTYSAGPITSKAAPAKWLKAYSKTNVAAYKSSNPLSTQLYMRIDDSTAPYSTMLGYETMTGIDAGGISFSHPNAYNYIQKYYSGATGNAPWFVIATDSMVYVGISFGASMYPASGYSVSCFGDFVSRKSGDAFRFCMKGSVNGISNLVPSDKGSPFINNIVPIAAARSYTAFSGVAQLSCVIPSQSLSNSFASGGGTSTFPNPEDYSLITCVQQLWEGASMRGRLPGVLVTPQNLIGYMANIPGFPTPIPLDGLVDDPTGKYLMVPNSNIGNSAGMVLFNLSTPWGN